MSFFKINSLPGTAWPAVPLPQYSSIWNAYQQLTQTQWMAPKDIESMQLKQLNVLLAHCHNNVPYYKGKIKPVHTLEDLRKIPLLTRRLYQNDFNNIRAVRLPPGMEMAKSPIYTSGTNGVPITVYKTNRDDLWWQALAMRDFEWQRMDPLKKIAAIRIIAMKAEDITKTMNGISTPTWLPSVNGVGLFQSNAAYAMDIRQDPVKQLEYLMKVKPSYLISLPSNLEILASLLGSTKIPNLELIQTIGEPLPLDLKKRLESSFGAKIVNLYSTNEAGYMASSCPEGHGLHVHSENILAEVLDANDKQCKPGETGRLVVTSLTNFANPFIRYDILDDVTLADGPCPCGRGLPLWKHVDGRHHPMLFLPNNRRKASTGIMLGIRQIGGIHQFQAIQHNVDHFTLRVVPNHEWTPEHEIRMIKFIQDEVEAPVKVDIEKLGVLERPNGKLKIIVVEPEQNNGK